MATRRAWRVHGDREFVMENVLRTNQQQHLTLKSSVECLTQRCREAESAEKVQISDGKENHDKKNLGKFFHPIGEN